MLLAGQYQLSAMGWIGDVSILVQLSHRYALKEDLPLVYTMYLQGLEDLGEEYNEEKALNFMLYCWSLAPAVLLLKGDEIIGFAGLQTYSLPYNDKTYLREYMFFISPENRGLKSWRTLCKGVQEVSDKYNITFIGDHKLTGNLKHHERLIRMAGARPVSILSMYGGD